MRAGTNLDVAGRAYPADLVLRCESNVERTHRNIGSLRSCPMVLQKIYFC